MNYPGYLLLGGGFPINFNGRGDINTAEELQYTRASMACGVVQARRIFSERHTNEGKTPSAETEGKVIALEEYWQVLLEKHHQQSATSH